MFDPCKIPLAPIENQLAIIAARFHKEFEQSVVECLSARATFLYNNEAKNLEDLSEKQLHIHTRCAPQNLAGGISGEKKWIMKMIRQRANMLANLIISSPETVDLGEAFHSSAIEAAQCIEREIIRLYGASNVIELHRRNSDLNMSD